jgi:GT2 family glycosyltransferase
VAGRVKLARNEQEMARVVPQDDPLTGPGGAVDLLTSRTLKPPEAHDTPQVSVVVPCFRRGDLLHEALESLQAQHFQDWEAIVVDDGSPSTEVEEAVAEMKDRRIRYVRHPRNLGVASARNNGFRQAKADLVLSLDSDDALRPAFLETTLKAFREDPSADCVYTDFQAFGNHEALRTFPVRSLEDMLRLQWIPGSGVLQRKSLWEGVGGYCEAPTMTAEEDWDYWIGACERGVRVVRIPEPLYLYRRHADSLTARTWSSDFHLRELIYARHKQTFDDHGLGSAFRAAGYLTSSLGYLRARQRARSARLAIHAVALQPGILLRSRSYAQLWHHLRRRRTG